MPHAILRNILSLMSASSRHCPRLPYQFWSVLFIPHFSAGIHLQDRYTVFYFLPTDTQGGYQEASALPSYHPLEISSAKPAMQNLMDKELVRLAPAKCPSLPRSCHNQENRQEKRTHSKFKDVLI